MSVTIDMRTIGGSRWCEDHNRAECVYNRSKGRGKCHSAAIKGTKGCRHHSGMKTSLAKAKGEAALAAVQALGEANAWVLTDTPKVDYRMSVLSVLQMSRFRLAAYAELLRRQVVAEGDTAEDPGQNDEPSSSGIIGFRYGAAGKDGIVYVQSEEVRALVALEAAERERVVKFAKTAHDMGISDRMTNLAERWADVMAGRLTLLLGDLDLNAAQAALVPAAIARHLSSIDLDEIGGSVTENLALSS